MFWFPFLSRIFHEHVTTKQSKQQATYDIYLDRYTNLFKYSFNKVIKCLQSVRNIAENPPCALRSRKLFFFFSSVLFSPSTFWHGAQRIQMSTLFIIIQYDFSDLLSILCGVFTKEKNDRIDKLLTPCKYLEIQHKETKKTLSRWFYFTIYSFKVDRILKSHNLQYNSLVR